MIKTSTPSIDQALPLVCDIWYLLYSLSHPLACRIFIKALAFQLLPVFNEGSSQVSYDTMYNYKFTNQCCYKFVAGYCVKEALQSQDQWNSFWIMTLLTFLGESPCSILTVSTLKFFNETISTYSIIAVSSFGEKVLLNGLRYRSYDIIYLKLFPEV